MIDDMNYRYLIKKTLNIEYPFLNSAYTRYLRFKQGAVGCIFMLHRVDYKDNKRLFPNENMKVTPQFLENLIIKYKKKGVSFFSLDDLYVFLQKPDNLTKPFVCFTLDDGYRDNYVNAYPIFKKYNVPFTVYVATDFPDNKAQLWWYELEDLILSNSELFLGNGEHIVCMTMDQKCEAFLYVRSLILKLKREFFLEEYIKLLNIDECHLEDYVKKHSMSWNDVKALANDPLCTIGGHSVSHPAFNVLSDEELSNEVLNGCKILEDNLGKRVEHFAYPFGTINEIGEREYLFLNQCHFKTVATTSYGFISSQTKIDVLPRIFLSEN